MAPDTTVLSSGIHPGNLNLPGATPAAKALTEELLKKDEEMHHCYFSPIGFHNHLSHHLLAAYDLGAPAQLIQKIYDDEAKIQRPIDLNVNGIIPEGSPKPGDIVDGNWTNWLGDQKAYSAYLSFFSDKLAKLGVVKTLEEYVFSPAANGNNSHMVFRLVAGALHPFIQIGYGLEFGCDVEIAAGLAQAAIHEASAFFYLPLDKFQDAEPNPKATKNTGRQPSRGPSLLYLLQQIYECPTLVPKLPYEPDALLRKRLNDFMEGGTRPEELHRIISQFDPGQTDEELLACVEEVIFLATLLTFGTGRPNRKPRLDFFLMHTLTSSLFLSSFVKHVTKLQYKRDLFRLYLQVVGIYVIVRGRPRIDPPLLMSYTENPVSPGLREEVISKAHSTALGAESRNPWPAIIDDALHAPDSHTIKSLRTLLYGAKNYGTLSKGDVIGAYDLDGKETHLGSSQLDGTVFVRAAGMLMDTLGWVTHGQKAGNWDRSALGWDDAWKKEDESN